MSLNNSLRTTDLMPSAPITRSAVDLLAVGEGQGRLVAVVLDAGQPVAEVHHALGQHAQQRLDEVAAMDQVGVGLVLVRGPGVLHDRITGGT